MKQGDKGPAVAKLQQQLCALGYRAGGDGSFGPTTEKQVRRFAIHHGLPETGAADDVLLAALANEHALNGIAEIEVQHLLDDEYYKAYSAKDTVYLHHTAGGSDAGNVIGAWEADKTKAGTALKVATAYVIGGPNRNDAAMDGHVYEAFDSDYWAHHLGTTLGNNTALNAKSVGIEVCSWGPLTRTRTGKFLTYVNTEVPTDNVVELDKPFRGYTFYHRYSDAQIESLRRLIVFLFRRHGIKPQANYAWTAAGFEMSTRAAKGEPGVWTHTHVRKDKSDLSPQPAMLAMLNKIQAQYA
jgi:peptidoglycan hydrolase-like protein with peptidoglycan-binding domain